MTKVHLGKAMVFPVVMYGCESWTIKKAEHWRIDAFERWWWTGLLRVPWSARRSNQSILKEISPGCSLEGLMLKLKLQYFGHLMRRTDSLENTLILGKVEREEGDVRGWDGWMASLTWWTWVWASFSSWWWTGKPGMLQSMGSQRIRHNWATELNIYGALLCIKYHSRCLTNISSLYLSDKCIFLGFTDKEMKAQGSQETCKGTQLVCVRARIRCSRPASRMPSPRKRGIEEEGIRCVWHWSWQAVMCQVRTCEPCETLSKFPGKSRGFSWERGGFSLLLLSPGSYCSLRDRPINEVTKHWDKQYQLYSKSQQTEKMVD